MTLGDMFRKNKFILDGPHRLSYYTHDIFKEKFIRVLRQMDGGGVIIRAAF